MKHLIIVILALLTAGYGFADEIYGDTIEKITRKEKTPDKKRIQEISDSLKFVKAKECVDSSKFVIIADNITFRDGYTVNPTNNLNFIQVDKGKAVVQLALNDYHPGLNGLGGITLNGFVSREKRRTDKKGNIIYECNVNGNGISAQISITLFKDSNKVIALVNANTSSESLTVYGKIMSPEDVLVITGMEF